MITASFKMTEDGRSIKAFCVKGHSGYADAGNDIVCASVSSAVMLTVNTAAEFFGIDLDINVDEGDIRCEVKEISENSDRLLNSLKAHLSEVSNEFPNNLKVTYRRCDK
jgi:hypothetical protein rflaF_00230